LINPLTVSSLMSVNKEIFSVLWLAVLLLSYKRRSFFYFLIAALLALSVRWQLLALTLLLVPLSLGWRFPARGRVAVLLMMLILLSAAYVLLAPSLVEITQNFESATKTLVGGSGLFEWLVRRQMAGEYILVFPIKAAHLMFGLGLRFDRLFHPEGVYNDIIQLLSSTSLLIMFLANIYFGKLKIGNDLIYISAIYIVFFSLTPIYVPRYFYPVYVIWALVLLMPKVPRLSNFVEPATSSSRA
jgi:hypothetical protein